MIPTKKRSCIFGNHQIFAGCSINKNSFSDAMAMLVGEVGIGL